MSTGKLTGMSGRILLLNSYGDGITIEAHEIASIFLEIAQKMNIEYRVNQTDKKTRADITLYPNDTIIILRHKED